jgi:hypothetical protein
VLKRAHLSAWKQGARVHASTREAREQTPRATRSRKDAKSRPSGSWTGLWGDWQIDVAQIAHSSSVLLVLLVAMAPLRP